MSSCFDCPDFEECESRKTMARVLAKLHAEGDDARMVKVSLRLWGILEGHDPKLVAYGQLLLDNYELLQSRSKTN